MMDEEKQVFLKREVPYMNIILSNFGSGDQREYKIHTAIVEDAIQKLLAPNVDDTTKSVTGHDGLGSILEPFDDKFVKLRILNGSQFDMVVGNVSIGMSFRQVARSMEVKRNVSHLSHLSGWWEGKVRMYVQAVTDINLQHIRELMTVKRCWAYSISIDSAKNRGDSYVEVGVRV